MAEKNTLELPLFGAKVLEGVANGCPISSLGKAIGGEDFPLGTLKDYMTSTYAKLHILTRPERMRHNHSMGRAVGICMAARLLQAKDLQRPGENLVFTMTPPSPESPIQYVDNYDRQGVPHKWPDQPLCSVRVPRGRPPQQPEAMMVDPDTRSFLTAVLLGIGNEEIRDRGISFHSRSNMKYRRARTGFRTNIQFAAHCVTQGVIQIPEEILDPTATVQPIRYMHSALLTLPSGVVYDGLTPPQPPSEMVPPAHTAGFDSV